MFLLIVNFSLCQPLSLFNVFANSSVDDLYCQSDGVIYSFKSGNIRGDPPLPPVSLGMSVATILCTFVIMNMTVTNDLDLIVCLPLNMHCMNPEYLRAGSYRCRIISQDVVECKTFNIS
jgi:hypothetical protein